MYSPKIKPCLIKKIWQLKQKIKKPMTELVNEAIETYFNKADIKKLIDESS